MIAIGHSHANTIFRAAQANGESIRLIQLRDLSRRKVLKENELGDPLKRKLKEALAEAGGGPVFSLVGGNMHVALGLFQHPVPFDFIVPGHDIAPIPGATVLPYGAICATIEEMTQFECQVLSALKRHLAVQLIHINCPPPTENIDILRDNPRRSEPPTLDISSPALRYKLWLVASLVIERFCKKMDILFLPPPKQALDPRGFLLDCFHRDAAHGNEDYGQLVIEQMKAFV